jgi:hypothetical protein
LRDGHAYHDDGDDDASDELQPDSDTEGKTRLEGFTQADALRLGRVLSALAAAGLIDEWHVFGPGIEGETAEAGARSRSSQEEPSDGRR